VSNPASSSKPNLATSIASWRDGSQGFFRFLADVQPRVPSSTGGFVPFVPGDRERGEIARALDGVDVSVACFCWPHRHGKTLTSAMIIVWRFLSRPAENIAVVANSEKQVVDRRWRTLLAGGADRATDQQPGKGQKDLDRRDCRAAVLQDT
jgi:hypothetical protein